MPSANSTFNNCVTQSGPLADNASFHFVDPRDLGMIYLLLINRFMFAISAVEAGFDGTLFIQYHELQEAQLPQRNSASAAHVEGARPSSPPPLPPLATPMRMVEFESHNVRQACRP